MAIQCETQTRRGKGGELRAVVYDILPPRKVPESEAWIVGQKVKRSAEKSMMMMMMTTTTMMMVMTTMAVIPK